MLANVQDAQRKATEFVRVFVVHGAFPRPAVALAISRTLGDCVAAVWNKFVLDGKKRWTFAS